MFSRVGRLCAVTLLALMFSVTEASAQTNQSPTAVVSIDPALLLTEGGITGLDGGATITLDASGSSDPLGGGLNYA